MKEKIGVLTYVDKDTHDKAVSLCDSRNISLRQLMRELLEWAGETDALELIRLGVRLPIWPEDTPKPSPNE